MKNCIGVFGSWRVLPDDPIYVQALELGRQMTLSGFTVLTGAYSGVMEAAARGAFEAGGSPIGVTCPEIDAILSPNQWIGQHKKTNDILERLGVALRMCSGAVFFPGRTGTASEVVVAYELRKKRVLDLPLILVGTFWIPLAEQLDLLDGMLPYERDNETQKIYTTANTIEEIMLHLGSA